MTSEMQRPQMMRDFERVQAAIHYLYEFRRDQPGLDEVAAHVALSPHHFQRLFRRWCGVTPKQLLSYLTVAEAKALLADRWSVLETSAELGLSGPARLHDAFVSVEAMTPGDYKAGGAGLEVREGLHLSPFGWVRVLATTRGVCGLEFTSSPDSPGELLKELPAATIVRDDQTGADLVAELSAGELKTPVNLHLKGTNFQIQVWTALLRLPSGRVTSYGELARASGRPRAARAVGSAMARNPVAWLIPCHRVVRGLADLGSYRYGAARKRAMVAWECARDPATAHAAA